MEYDFTTKLADVGFDKIVETDQLYIDDFDCTKWLIPQSMTKQTVSEMYMK